MSISIKQFLALPIGAKIVINKNAFVVKNLDQVEERMEPVLINVATGERLYAAIYVAHLMRVEGVFDMAEQVHQEGGTSSGEVEAPSAALLEEVEATLPSENVLSLRWESREENGAIEDVDNLFFAPEILVGRKEYVLREHYEAFLLDQA